MSTITTINGSDTITSSRTVINTNFANLNADKIETSVLDTDTALTANSDTKIPTQKAVKAYVDALSTLALAVETTTGTTHSLTTDGTQKVIVWVKGEVVGSSTDMTVLLNYDGAQRDTITLRTGTSTWKGAFSLMYTATHSATTKNITVTSANTLSNVVIIVLKI